MGEKSQVCHSSKKDSDVGEEDFEEIAWGG